MTQAFESHSFAVLSFLVMLGGGNQLHAGDNGVDLSSSDTGLSVHVYKSSGDYEVI